MPMLFVALIFVLSILLLTFLLLYRGKRQAKKRLDQMLHRFSHLGTENDLSFSSQEVFGNKVIGVDGIKRKMLVLESLQQNIHTWHFIDLGDVKSCRLRKKNDPLSVGTTMPKTSGPEVRSIALEFEHRQTGQTVVLPFYHHLANSDQELKVLEAKARDWETMLSKMLINKRPL